MKKLIVIFAVIFTALPALAGQLSVPRKIIDSPTAGNLPRGGYHLDFKIFPGGGLLGEVSVGLTNRIYFGLSYGAANVIGSGVMEANDRPGILGQFRILEENLVIPALALGYNNQPLGPYVRNGSPYYVNSKGIYAVASKNYRLLGNLGLHGGVNYRIEEQDPVPNLFFMVNKELGGEISLCAEYDAAINNDEIDWGHLNAGIAWLFDNRIQLELDFKNILEFTRGVDANRELRIVYIDKF